MAIPPIISNFPLFRIFRTDRSGAGAGKGSSVPSAPAGDTVEISAAAQKKLEAAQVLSANDPGRIHAVTSQIKSYIEQNPVSLGLNPAFE